MATKLKSKAKTKAATRASLKMAPFRMTVHRIKDGFTIRFDGISGSKLVPLSVALDFPAWWADNIIDQLKKVKR